VTSPGDFTAEQERIRRGGLPDSAQRRLAELRDAGLASSFFSVAGDAVGAGGGVHALGQVLGASSCRLAGGVVRRTRNVRGDTRQGAWREWDGPKRSWAEARRRALERLLAEAAQLGADAVLGVQARREELAGATEPVIEVLLTGTAVRLDRPLPAGLTASLAGPQEFVRLREAGIEIAGIAGAFASVQVTAGNATRAVNVPWRRAGNRELEDLTIGVYEARRLAIERLLADARALKAHGVIGVDLADSLGAGRRSVEGMTITVHAWGSAVRRTRASGLRPSVVVGVED
jgi:uncharacterized protein YbjQ (UPF0145 family)